MAIKAIIFDLGRVLLNIDFSRGLFCQVTGADEDTPDKVIHRLVRNELFIEYNSGRITPREFHSRLIQRLNLDLDFEAFAASWCDIFTWNNGMEVLLETLIPRLPVGILSDTDPLHWTHVVEVYPVLARVQAATLSYETGFMKPAAEAYRLAAKNLGVAAEDCFFTDDLPANIEGARAVGMHAALFHSVADTRRELQALGVLPAQSAQTGNRSA